MTWSTSITPFLVGQLSFYLIFAGGKQRVSLKSFEDFWAWFSPGLHKLRHQRHLGAMWQSG